MAIDDDTTSGTVVLPPESLASYHSVFGEAPVMVALYRDRRFLYVNQAALAAYGASSSAEIIGRDVRDFSAPEEIPLVNERLALVETQRIGLPLRQGHFRRLDGTPFEVQVMTVPVQVGGVDVVQSMALDVTEQARAEREFARSEEKFSAAFNASPDGIVIVRLSDLVIVTANAAWCRLTGCDLQHVLGAALGAIPVQVKPPDWRELADRMEREGRVRELGLHYQRQGEVEWRHALISAELMDLQGEPCALAIARDDTDDRVLQARVRQSQKMDAVGQLAGGIAHDFNNLLTVIRANAELVLGDLPAAGPSHEDLSSILAACDRAATLTRQLLAFSRTQTLDTRPFDLNETLRSAGQMISRLLGPSITIDWRLADLPPVLADPGQVEQILMNLLVNARDAMPDGGTITVESARFEVTPETFRDQVTGIVVVPGPYVRWTVTDRGHGMTPETRARVFEPFFTTKQPGSGTGLGLATVYGIVKQSQGYIWIDSAPGVGTSVHVYLPVAPNPG